jgi:hypothetical protein
MSLVYHSSVFISITLTYVQIFGFDKSNPYNHHHYTIYARQLDFYKLLYFEKVSAKNRQKACHGSSGVGHPNDVQMGLL